ncbi:MAG: hypothetical protein J6T80_04625 [Paludibacteraceae bacterium]|nr:hypothetical protein [Paludibacteraceae bacterium]
MKKLFLFAAMMLLTVNLMATDYPLSVADVVVTDANEDDVLGDGTVSYDDDTHILTLSNAHLTGSIWYHPAWTDDSEFSIYVVGKCSIILDGTSKAGAIYSQVARTNIVGFGQNPELEVSNLNHTGSGGAAIKAFGSGTQQELHIDGLKVKATSDSDDAIDCSALNAKAGSFIDAQGGIDDRGIGCSKSSISYTETMLVYDLQNNPNGIADHNHMIIAPGMSVEEISDVLILGQPITNYTVNDVLQNGVGDTWDASKKILTLKDENISSTGDEAFLTFSTPATLSLQGGTYKSINNDTKPVIKTTANLTITGGPETSITTAYASALVAEPGTSAITIIFDKANIMTFGGSAYSIQKEGVGSGAVNLSFINSHVEMENVSGVASVNYENCAVVGMGSGPFIFDPYDGGFIDQSMCEPSCSPMTTIEINTDGYPLSVNAIPVFPYNASDIMGNGKISYNHNTQTLTVAEGADLDIGSTTPTVEVDDQDLTIVFEGIPGSVYSDDNEVIKMTNGTDHKLTIISKMGSTTGTINMRSDNNDQEAIIDATGADVEFRGVNKFSLWGESTYLDAPAIKAKKLIVNANLVVSNANTSTSADILENVPVELNENIELDGLDLQINTSTHEVEWKTASSDKIREVVFVAKDLDNSASLQVAGVNVTKLNKSDILGDGKISYDEANKKLTLDNARIITAAANAIYALTIPDDKLTIEVKGTSVISCDQIHGISSMVDLDIVGSGSAPYLSIDVEADGSAFMPIDLYSENLGVKDMTLLATTHHAAAAAISIGMIVGHLTVNNADLRAAIEDCDPSLVAINCNQLTLGAGVALRYDAPTWPMLTWEGSYFDGSDRTHIWIGKNADFPTDVENTFVPAEKAVKVIRDGQLFIIRGERIYTIQGALVK